MRSLRLVTVVVGTLLGCAIAAGAQPIESGRTVAVSYSTMQFLEEGSSALPVGWLVTLGGNVNHTVTGVFETGANYRPYRRGTLQI